MQVEYIGQSVELVGSYGGDDTIESAARTCTQTTTVRERVSAFVRKLIKRGHMSPLEFGFADTLIECDRGIQQELTRHREFSYNIESTRFIDYRRTPVRYVTKPTRDMDVPPMCVECLEEYCALGARLYESWRNAGVTRDYLRKYFTLALASRMRMAGNLRMWFEMLPKRTSRAAHPEVREVASGLRHVLSSVSETLFGDGEETE